MYKILLEHESEIITLQDGNDDYILPLNINELENSYKRSEKYHGVLRSFGNSLVFSLNAAKYIDKILNEFGIGTSIEIKMYYSDTGAEVWHQYYSGKLDLTTFKKNYKSSGLFEVECNIVNGDYEDKIISNLNSVYDVGKGGELFTDVLFRERNSISVADYASDYTITDPALNLIDPTNTLQLRVCVPRIIKQKADSNFNNSVVDFSCVNSIDAIEFCLFQSTANATVSVTCSIYFYEQKSFGDAAHDFVIKAHVFNKYNSLKNIYTLGNCTLIHAIPDSPTPQHINYYYRAILTDETFTLAEGDKFYIAVSPTVGYLAFLEFYFKSLNDEFENTLSLTITEAKPASIHKAVGVMDAVDEIVRNITGQSNTTLSNIFSSEVDYITTGELLRTAYNDADIDTKQINTSLDAIFNSFSLPKCLGIGFDVLGFYKRLRLDHASAFYSAVIVYDLGEVRNFSEEVAAEYFYTQALFQYPNFTNEVINGLYDFNTRMRLTLPTNFNKNELSVISDFRADSGGIEEARRTPLSANNSTDTKYDDALFMVSADAINGTLQTIRDEFMNDDGFTGVPDNTFTMNAAYYPPFALRYWAWWLLSGLQYYLTGTTASDVGTGDYKMNKDFTFYVDNQSDESVHIGMTHITGIDYDYDYLLKIADLTTTAPNTMFEPVYYNFDAPVTWQFAANFSQNRHGVIKFKYLGKTYYGYAMNVPAVPGKVSNFRLLKISKYALSILN